MRQAINSFVDRHPVLIYTLARLALFAAVLAPLYVLGLRGFLLLVLAVVLSGVLSLVLLNRVRAGFSSVVSGYFSRVNQRIDAATRAEDDDLDASTDQRQSQSQAQPGQQ
jgi:hypothetical protein